MLRFILDCGGIFLDQKARRPTGSAVKAIVALPPEVVYLCLPSGDGEISEIAVPRLRQERASDIIPSDIIPK